jgi:anti-sigma factor RsiW
VQGECDRAHQWVSSAVDGELSEFERVLLDAHLSGCSACRAFEADVVRATDELRAAPLEPFAGAIEFRRVRRARFRLAPAAAALAVAAVGLGSLLTSTQFRNATAAEQFRTSTENGSGVLTGLSASQQANFGIAPEAVRRGDAIDLRAVRHFDRRAVRETVRRTAAHLGGGPVIDKR